MFLSHASRRHGLVKRTACRLVVALLVVGFPGPGMAWAASQRVPAPASCALSVTTLPAGAAVYVNGELQGTAPVALEGLSAGDHRVRVVKPGYLENIRVVGLRSGVAENLSVALTPDVSYGTSASIQVEDYEPEEEGGGNKLLYIGLGAVAVGAGAFLLLRNTNEPPTAGSVSASPGVGLASVTSISFNATGASDPDGDSLTYRWDFGDGATGSGQSASHTYDSAGSYSVTVTVSDGEEQATASGSVTIRSLTGTWVGDIRGRTGRFMTWTLSQNGTSLSGTYSDTVNGSGNVTGTVSAPLRVSFQHRIPGFIVGNWTGTISDDINTISGTTSWFIGDTATFRIERQ
jgi:PKD repeat protein